MSEEKRKVKKDLMLVSGLLVFVLVVSQTMRTYILNTASEHNLLHMVDDVVVLADFLLLFCIGTGLLVVGFLFYILIDEHKKPYQNVEGDM